MLIISQNGKITAAGHDIKEVLAIEIKSKSKRDRRPNRNVVVIDCGIDTGLVIMGEYASLRYAHTACEMLKKALENGEQVFGMPDDEEVCEYLRKSEKE